MNAAEEYGLTLKIEVLKEYGAHLLAVIYRYQKLNNLDFNAIIFIKNKELLHAE